MKDEGLTLDSFYPSFLNWCNRVVERISDPAYVGLTDDEQHCFLIIQQEPIPSMPLLEVMRRYRDASDITGHSLLSGLVDARATHHSKKSSSMQGLQAREQELKLVQDFRTYDRRRLSYTPECAC